MSDSDIGRRKFINWFLGTSSGALMASILFPIARYISPPKIPEASTNQVEAGLTSDPAFADAAFKIVRFGAEPVIVVKASEGHFVALSATCTHLDCIVGYRKDKHLIWCNCHNGRYDLTGRNVGGPPPKPLTPFKVNLVSKGVGQPQMIVVSRS